MMEELEFAIESPWTESPSPERPLSESPSPRKKPGTLFIEVGVPGGFNIEDESTTTEIRETLEEQLSRSPLPFVLLENLLENEYFARIHLDRLYDRFRGLEEIRVVEYSGPATDINSYLAEDVHIKVQVYQLYRFRRPIDDHEDLPEAEITPLPHIRFDRQWNELCFEKDIKLDLVWMLTNILRFSKRAGKRSGDTNPLILIHGPPGTGKTTLCQGLAQKISIRLNTVYRRARLIEIRAAALLSRYYSESAKQIDKMFMTLENICQDNPAEFICVLIDEVETIAIRREASAHGESQESLRATNAFLTGLDRMKRYLNIVFLCTSNMVHSLDAAFVDRCGLKVEVDSPSLASQYGILRNTVEDLMLRGIIDSDEELPLYRDAEVERHLDSVRPGSRLLHILELIKSMPTIFEAREGAISGRSLAQLPEQALLRYLREEECSLDVAMDMIEKYIRAERMSGKELKDKELANEDYLERTLADEMSAIRVTGRKRDASEMEKEDETIEGRDVLEECLQAMGEILARSKRRAKSSRGT